MRNTRKPQSRQVRRAAERRRAKQLAQKDRAQKGSQSGKEPQEPDEPKRKDNWRFGIDMGVRLLVPFIRDIVGQVKDYLFPS